MKNVTAILDACSSFIRGELHIDADYAKPLADVFWPLAQRLAERRAQSPAPLTAGIGGAQGSGKTTAARILRFLLAERGLRVATFSLDDLYLPLAERRRVRAAHPDDPYFRWRGNPGSHDPALGVRTIERLLAADETSVTPLPAFDKSAHDGQGDRLPEPAWPEFRGRPDIVILEGWMVGFARLPDADLAAHVAATPAVSAFVAARDPTGRFTRAVNRGLDEYRELFARLDPLIFFKIASLGKIVEWRRLQEAKLREQTGRGMTDAEVADFCEPYLTLTAIHGLRVLGRPAAGRIVIDIGDDHLLKGAF